MSEELCFVYDCVYARINIPANYLIRKPVRERERENTHTQRERERVRESKEVEKNVENNVECEQNCICHLSLFLLKKNEKAGRGEV